MGDRCDWLFEGHNLVMMGDDAAPPLLDALFGIQRWRVGKLGLEHEPSLRLAHDGLDGRPLCCSPWSRITSSRLPG
jgi:hypothetical protein